VFDLRYHVASLAAVFLALVIGILVGIGISDRGLVDKAQRRLLEQRVDQLESDLSDARARARDLAAQQRAAQAFVDETYPSLIANRLRGKRIALVFLGPAEPRIRSTLDVALSDSGATGWARVRALKLPLDFSAMDDALAKQDSLHRYVGDERLPALGRALGEELAVGGDTPLWRALAEQIVAERTGSETQRADGVVVVRTGAKQYDGTARFLQGFYDGLIAAPVPVVGVGTSAANPAPIAAFRRNGISTVDDVEQATGRLALALLLAGGKAGHYGLKESATDGILPPLESLARG
jgi:outer membrane murein-binding lipoprotein Lpp